MKVLALLATFVCMFTLAGCAGRIDLGPGSPLGDITQLTVTDLQAALADATAHRDQPAMQCYPVLINIVQSLPGQVPSVEVKGVASAFQAARDLAKKAQTFTGANDPLIQAVNLGCAALFNDAQGDILRLGIRLRP